MPLALHPPHARRARPRGGAASLARWAIDAHAVLAVFDALGVDAGAPAPLGVAERLRCTDPDDQMFIDLAIARRAQALLTRDRALLRLASRARRFGVLVATPEAWLRRLAEPPCVLATIQDNRAST